MPEYPDIEAYRSSLQHLVVGHTLVKLSIRHPFLLRTVDPPISEIEGRQVASIERVAKQLVFEFSGGVFAILHLMVAGRLRWTAGEAKAPAKIGLAAFRFSNGTLVLTEAGTKRRASLSLVRASLADYDPGGVDVFETSPEAFHGSLTRENHTIKRALTDQRIVAGIGNAYSDEILHAAGISPFLMTNKLDAGRAACLLAACRNVLSTWKARLAPKKPGAFPKKVTAFHPDMAVHGKYGEPCPVCGTLVQRIRYAENESNYCPTCQTDGRIYSDRALARLLKSDWPRTVTELDELQERNAARSSGPPRQGGPGIIV